VLPHFSDTVQVEAINEDDLAVVWLEDDHESFGGNLLYEDICDVSWAEVAATIGEERMLLELASESGTDEQFDYRADALVRERYSGERYTDDGGEVDKGPLARFQDIDLGAMSAVAALVAAGAMTNTSCRGHQSRRGERRPLVRFVCDGALLPIVVDCAKQAECGLLLDHVGNLQLYASDVDAFVRFAEVLLSISSDLPIPPTEGPLVSRSGIEEYIEMIEVDRDFDYFSRRHLAMVDQMISSSQPLSGQDPLF
jgi:hypothetical protein